MQSIIYNSHHHQNSNQNDETLDDVTITVTVIQTTTQEIIAAYVQLRTSSFIYHSSNSVTTYAYVFL